MTAMWRWKRRAACRTLGSRVLRMTVWAIGAGVGLVTHAAAPPEGGTVLRQVEGALQRLEAGVAATESAERKLELLDAAISYLGDFSQTVAGMRENLHRTAYTFEGAKPVTADEARLVLGFVQRIKEAYDALGELEPPGIPDVKDVIQGVALEAGFQLFSYFSEAMLRSIERLATAMHALNVASLTLGELREPVYPGLRRADLVAVYEQIQRARVLLRECDDALAALGKGTARLREHRGAIEAVERDYHAWVLEVAAALDRQILAGASDPAAFQVLEARMLGVVEDHAELLGSVSVAAYQTGITGTTRVAALAAAEGAEAARQLAECTALVEEMGRILSGCEASDLDVRWERAQWTPDSSRLEDIGNRLKISLADLIDPAVFPPRALDTALMAKDLYGSGLALRTLLDRHGRWRTELLAAAAKWERVDPVGALLSLPTNPSFPVALTWKLKLLNPLGEPLGGQAVSVTTRGFVKTQSATVTSDAQGGVEVNVLAEAGLAQDPASASVVAEAGTLRGRVQVTALFQLAGAPARVEVVSQPPSPALPGALLLEPWVVEVHDAQGATVNNRTLTARFEALDGGSVSPLRTEIIVPEGGVVPTEEARFSAQVGPGPVPGQVYRFRVTVDPTGSPALYADLALTTDELAVSPTAPRLLVQRISFGVSATDLARDALASKVMPGPSSTPYTLRLHGVEAIRKMHEHYVTRTNTHPDGTEELVQVLVARHPYDEVSSERELTSMQPTARYSASGVVRASEGVMTVAGRGECRVWMEVGGMVGVEPAHPDCQTKFVKLGPVFSPTNRVRVFEISEVNYTCTALGDHFQTPVPFEVQTEVKLTTGAELLVRHGREQGRLGLRTQGQLVVRQDPPILSSGVIRAEASGWGATEISAFLQDPGGDSRYERSLGKMTLNTVTAAGPWGILAGEEGRTEVQVQGGAEMSRYLMSWHTHPAPNGAAERSSFVRGESSFAYQGNSVWVAENVFQYSQQAVSPLSYSTGPDDTWSASLLSRATGELVALGPQTKHGVKALPPRLNRVILRAFRPGTAQPVPTAPGLDLFSANAVRWKAEMRLLPVGVFARSVERGLATTVRWSLADSPLLSIPDLGRYLLQQEGRVAGVGNELSADGQYYLLLETPLEAGTAELAAAVEAEAHRKLYGIHNALRGDAAVLHADEKLTLRANVLRLDNVLEEGVVRLRLRSDGPTALDLHTARWSVEKADGTSLSEETVFVRYSDAGWQTVLDEPAGTKQVVAELLDATGIVVGHASMTPKPTKLAVVAPSVVPPGDPGFAVAIEVRNIPQLRMYSGRLDFDPARLEVTAVNEGDFLRGTTGRTVFEAGTNTPGQVTFTGSRANSESASGSGTLVRLTFRARSMGEAPLTFGTTFLYDSPTTVVPFQALETTVTIREPSATVANLDWTDDAPAVDGVVEPGWTAVPEHLLNRVIRGQTGQADDIVAGWRATWDAQNLHLLVEVRDDRQVVDSAPGVPWDDDSIELYLDGDNSKSGVYDGRNDFHVSWTALGLAGPPRFGPNSRLSQEGSGFVTAGRTSATGYVWEAAIAWETLGVTPVPGLRLGLDLQVNDDDDGAAADTGLAWAQDCFCAWESPSRFGTVALVRASDGIAGWTATLDQLVTQRGLPPAAANPFADPDLDGWANIAEYALGATAAEALDAANRPGLFRAEPAGSGEVALILPRTDQPDVEYVLEASKTLADGSWTPVARRPKRGEWTAVEAGGGLSVSSPAAGGTRVTVATGGAGGAFFRVRFSL